MTLLPRPGLSPFVTFSDPIELPVAHGEGRFLMSDPGGSRRSKAPVRLSSDTAARIPDRPRIIPPIPTDRRGPSPACATRRAGSSASCPTPSDYIEPWHHPRWTRRSTGQLSEGDWPSHLHKRRSSILNRSVLADRGPTAVLRRSATSILEKPPDEGLICASFHGVRRTGHGGSRRRTVRRTLTGRVRKAKSLLRNLAIQYRNQAIRLSLQGYFAESESYSREALRLQPDDVDILNELGVASGARDGRPRPRRSTSRRARSTRTTSGS